MMSDKKPIFELRHIGLNHESEQKAQQCADRLSRLFDLLRPYKNYLQTAALVCARSEKAGLTDLLLKSGVVRLCAGARMSASYTGMPHDGEYPLRRYMKVASVEVRATPDR